jgi:hypothetical protein
MGSSLRAQTSRDGALVSADLDVLLVRPETFHRTPQIGTPCTMQWRELASYLSRPSYGETKECEGALSPAKYADNIRRKSNLVHVCAIVLDVDEGGDVDTVASVLERYACIVHETFSSTPQGPRCRAWLLLKDWADAATYETTHAILRAHMLGARIVVDAGAKDASRLSYAPVRRLGSGYRVRVVDGRPIDARAIIATQPPPPPRPPPRPPRPEHRDAYIRGALAKAANAVAGAVASTRHYMLGKEAFRLSRPELGLDDAAIERALLPAFLAATGGIREHEGARRIRDAIRARRGGVQ